MTLINKEDPIVIRVSSLSDFISCSRKPILYTYAVNEQKMEFPSSSAQQIGTDVHAVLDKKMDKNIREICHPNPDVNRLTHNPKFIYKDIDLERASIICEYSKLQNKFELLVDGEKKSFSIDMKDNIDNFITYFNTLPYSIEAIKLDDKTFKFSSNTRGEVSMCFPIENYDFVIEKTRDTPLVDGIYKDMFSHISKLDVFEKRFDFPVVWKDHLFKISGQCDMFSLDGKFVGDWKTASQKPKGNANYKMQATTYKLLLSLQKDITNDGTGVICLYYIVKTKQPYGIPVFYKVEKVHLLQAQQNIFNFCDAYLNYKYNGIMPPESQNPYCGNCHFKALCDEENPKPKEVSYKDLILQEGIYS